MQATLRLMFSICLTFLKEADPLTEIISLGDIQHYDYCSHS